MVYMDSNINRVAAKKRPLAPRERCSEGVTRGRLSGLSPVHWELGSSCSRTLHTSTSRPEHVQCGGDRRPQAWEEYSTCAHLLGCVKCLRLSLGQLKSGSCQGWFCRGHLALLRVVFMLTWHLLQVCSPNAPCTRTQVRCFGWHPFLFELEDSKEHHILKCQESQHGVSLSTL